MLIDYYVILGVRRNASTDEVKKAYRKQAKSLHPDVSKDALATAKFQLLNEAYHVLINLKKRRIYDYTLRHRVEYNARDRRTRRDSATYNSYYKFYTGHTYSESQRQRKSTDQVYKIKTLDNVLFYTLFGIGVIGIIFGIFDIIFKEWMGLSNLNGLFFSLSFTSLLVYGWRLMGKQAK